MDYGLLLIMDYNGLWIMDYNGLLIMGIKDFYGLLCIMFMV